MEVNLWSFLTARSKFCRPSLSPLAAACVWGGINLLEFHLLLKEEQTAAYSAEIWKRFRKWGGIPTGATQNVKDLLSSPEIENILENSDFITLLNQASGDRRILAERLNLSPDHQKYIDNSEPGAGLLIFENVILPFTNPIPSNTELYKIMTTRLSEVVEGGT